MATRAAEALNDASDIGFCRTSCRTTCSHARSRINRKRNRKGPSCKGERPHVYRRAQCAHPFGRTKSHAPAPPDERKKRDTAKKTRKPRPGHVANTIRSHEGVMANQGHHDKQEKETNTPPSQQAEGPPARTLIPPPIQLHR